MKRYALLWIFLTALVAGWLWNEMNLYVAKKQGAVVHYDAVIRHPDNSWYTPPIKYLLQGKGYTLDPKEPELAVRRTPGYPLFYGLHYWLFGEEGSYRYIRYSQLLFYALASVLLALAVFNFTSNRRWAFFAGLLNALLPFTVCYLYQVLTEGITTSILATVLYLYSLYYKKEQQRYVFFTGIALGVLFLTRPLLGLLLPAVGLTLFSWRELFRFKWAYWKSIILVELIVLGGFLLVVTPWTMRNYQVTDGEIIVAEKAYHGDFMDYGRAHLQLRSLYSSWTNTGDGRIERLSSALIAAPPPQAKPLINNFLSEQPTSVYEVIPRDSFRQALQALYQCYQDRAEFRQVHPEAKRAQWLNLPCQFELEAQFKRWQVRYQQQRKIAYHVKVPAKTLFKIVVQSHSNAVVPLAPTATTLSEKLGKLMLLSIHVLLFLSLLLFVILGPAEAAPLRFIGAFTFVFLSLFLAVALRHFENRYMVPLFPLLYIAAAYWLAQLWKGFKGNETI